MNSLWRAGGILTGVLATAISGFAQSYTISAKPGVVNYIEGNASLNGAPLSAQSLKGVALNPNDVISTDLGKAEVLLTPGVFLRMGDNTQVRMISPSLTDTQVEVKSGTAMIEVDDLVKETHLTVLNHGSTTGIEKPGLYRFSAGDPPTVGTLEGKAQVFYGERKVEIGKGRETVISDALKAEKFDKKRPDDLFAWSNDRSAYDAASSYQVSKNAALNNAGLVSSGYTYSPGYYGGGPGWFWNAGLSNWAWLPINGAFYSPFGYGFYSPALVGYAPVIYGPLYNGSGYYGSGGGYKRPLKASTSTPGPATARLAVPVNPTNPPALGSANSLAASQAMRNQTVRAYSSTGFSSASGAHIAAGRSSGGGGAAAPSATGWSAGSGGGLSSGRVSSASSGASRGSSGSSHR